MAIIGRLQVFFLSLGLIAQHGRRFGGGSMSQREVLDVSDMYIRTCVGGCVHARVCMRKEEKERLIFLCSHTF